MTELRYKNWHICDEPMGDVASHTFFHHDFETNHQQGMANSVEEAKQKIDELERENG